MTLFRSPLRYALFFALVNLLLHLATNGIWGFHRDELLYLAMGEHLDWGYWSNPPLIGLLGALANALPGEGPWTVRLIPAALSSMLVVATGLIARELGGRDAAVAMASASVLLSTAMLRVGVLFQPVIIDVLCWTIVLYLVLRYLNTSNPRWLWGIGLVLGVGLMNKYSVVILIAGILAALPFTAYRSVFNERAFYGALGVTLAVVLPNLIWQAVHGLPVVYHMQELRTTQLVHVAAVDFLLEQFLLHLAVVWVWILGLVYLFRTKTYRLLGWVFIIVIALLAVLGGKSYYTLGLYPMLFGAGARWLEMRAPPTVQAGLFATALVLALVVSPIALPYLKPSSMAAYGENFRRIAGVDAPFRWEGGTVHELPQDYADMLGWDEIASLVTEAYETASDGAHVVIYGENYGQAGAIDHYAPELPEPLSLSDSYRLWMPRSLPSAANTLIYVNDELGEDVDSLFADIRLVGSVQTPLARERGTMVFLCQNPRTRLAEFWRRNVAPLLDRR